MNEIQTLVEEEIRLGGFPGAVWAYGTPGHVVTGHAGRQTYCPESRPDDTDSVFDMASVSKVVATTSLAMHLWDAKKLDLDRPVAADLPTFGANGKEAITPRNLLLHDAGLIAFRPYHRTYIRRDDVIAAIDAERLVYPTGTKSVYSDLSMIVLARLLERLDGRPFEVMVRKILCRPLDMDTTGYFSVSGPTMIHPPKLADVIPTEIVEDWRRDLRRATYGDLGSIRRFGEAPDYIHAEVHDPTATALGGVAGHAGLFSTVGDLVRFAENMLSPAPKVFSPDARALFTKRAGDLSTRALGWDTKSQTGSSAGGLFGPRSFGHTGYTGTSIWIDPEAKRFAILLTNRVHPTSANERLLPFRPLFHNAAWRSIDTRR